MYLIMSNIITLHSFAFFVHITDLKSDTCIFIQKLNLGEKMGPGQDNIMLTEWYFYLTKLCIFIQRSPCGYLYPKISPSHHACHWSRSPSHSPKLTLSSIPRWSPHQISVNQSFKNDLLCFDLGKITKMQVNLSKLWPVTAVEWTGESS
jgi:hypothetical protein